MILIDTHVHIHPCFDVGEFLFSAAKNFASAAAKIRPRQPCQSVICLADTPSSEGFDRLSRQVGEHGSLNGWRISRTEERHSLMASHRQLGSLAILAGRQVRCREGIELLSLCTSRCFQDGAGLQDVFNQSREAGAVTVLPWGFGKWMGERGDLVRRFINERTPPQISLGDNSGRPGFWREPAAFAEARSRGFRIFPGSDPLPFAAEVTRVASYGLSIEKSLNPDRPAHDVKEILSDGMVPVQSFGHLEKPLRFLRNQLAMQIVKRGRGRTHR